jgi:hypothetical protein
MKCGFYGIYAINYGLNARKQEKENIKNAAQLCWTNFLAEPSFVDMQTLPTTMALLFADSLPRGLSVKNLRQLVCQRSAKTSPTALDSAVDEGLTTPSSFADWDGAATWLSAKRSLPSKTSPTGLCQQDFGYPIGEVFADRIRPFTDCFKQSTKAAFLVVSSLGQISAK